MGGDGTTSTTPLKFAAPGSVARVAAGDFLGNGQLGLATFATDGHGNATAGIALPACH
jgi:hypothetical protein